MARRLSGPRSMERVLDLLPEGSLRKRHPSARSWCSKEFQTLCGLCAKVADSRRGRRHATLAPIPFLFTMKVIGERRLGALAYISFLSTMQVAVGRRIQPALVADLA